MTPNPIHIFCRSWLLYDKSRMYNWEKKQKDKISYYMKRDLCEEITEKYKHIHNRILVNKFKKKETPKELELFSLLPFEIQDIIYNNVLVEQQIDKNKQKYYLVLRDLRRIFVKYNMSKFLKSYNSMNNDLPINDLKEELLNPTYLMFGIINYTENYYNQLDKLMDCFIDFEPLDEDMDICVYSYRLKNVNKNKYTGIEKGDNDIDYDNHINYVDKNVDRIKIFIDSDYFMSEFFCSNFIGNYIYEE